jgi:hypothetical protein
MWSLNTTFSNNSVIMCPNVNSDGDQNAYISGATEFTSGFSEVCVTRSLVLCVCFVDL